jgi:CheY-like chemotaxis protein
MVQILVVDDEPDIRLALSLCLEESGYEVSEASDGSEVMAAVAAERPDLILLDISMPHMDGFQTLEQLKSDAGTRDIPVVMVSARQRSEDQRDARALGAIDFISKPWIDGELELKTQWALHRGKPGKVPERPVLVAT